LVPEIKNSVGTLILDICKGALPTFDIIIVCGTLFSETTTSPKEREIVDIEITGILPSYIVSYSDILFCCSNSLPLM
jgi:hypothetical protein